SRRHGSSPGTPLPRARPGEHVSATQSAHEEFGGGALLTIPDQATFQGIQGRAREPAGGRGDRCRTQHASPHLAPGQRCIHLGVHEHEHGNSANHVETRPVQGLGDPPQGAVDLALSALLGPLKTVLRHDQPSPRAQYSGELLQRPDITSVVGDVEEDGRARDHVEGAALPGTQVRGVLAGETVFGKAGAHSLHGRAGHVTPGELARAQTAPLAYVEAGTAAHVQNFAPTRVQPCGLTEEHFLTYPVHPRVEGPPQGPISHTGFGPVSGESAFPEISVLTVSSHATTFTPVVVVVPLRHRVSEAGKGQEPLSGVVISPCHNAAMSLPRVIAIDLDGTLLDNNSAVTDRSRRALTSATEAGVRVVIVTGRPPRDTDAIAALFD